MVLTAIDHSRGVLVGRKGRKDAGFVVPLGGVLNQAPGVEVVLALNAFVVTEVTEILDKRPGFYIRSQLKKREDRRISHQTAVLCNLWGRRVGAGQDITEALGVICDCGKVQRPSDFNDFSACQCCRLALGEAVGVVEIAPITE